MFAGHDIKDISEGNEIEKNANIMSVSWRLPLVSEYPRKEKKKAELRKANHGNPRKQLMSDYLPDKSFTCPGAIGQSLMYSPGLEYFLFF